MRTWILAGLVVFLAACNDSPTNLNDDAATIQATVIDGLGNISGDPLCGGLSPCDAYRYSYNGDAIADGFDGSTPLDGVLDSILVGDPASPTAYSLGLPGFCFLPPTTENHLSEPPCAGTPVTGLTGFELVVARVEYTDDDNDGYPDGSDLDNDGYIDPPTVHEVVGRSPLVEDVAGGFYASSVRFRKNGQNPVADGSTFRLYVVRDDIAWAHRDVIVDPNLTTPADGYVKSIGNGNEPIKVLITSDVSCNFFDTQEGGTDNAATCLIVGDQEFTFNTARLSTTWYFPPGNQAFVADFEVSECLTLGFYNESDATTGLPVPTGNALVDTPLADCKISVSSDEVQELDVPYTVAVTLTDPRWLDLDGPYVHSRINLFQTDEEGTFALPYAEDRGFPVAIRMSSAESFFRWGVDKLMGILGPEPLRARPSTAFDGFRLSDFQVSAAGVGILDPSLTIRGVACASGLPSCIDLGTVAGSPAIVENVAIQVVAPTSNFDGDPLPPIRPTTTDGYIPVPGTRLHFFPSGLGTVSCPFPDPGNGQLCIEPGENDPSSNPVAAVVSYPFDFTDPTQLLRTDLISRWDHLTVVSGDDGRVFVDWQLDDGANELIINGCGVARLGSLKPVSGDAASDRIWGSGNADAATYAAADPLFDPGGQRVNCLDREAAAVDPSAFDNGPNDYAGALVDWPLEPAWPFEPVDTENLVALYGLGNVVKAQTCSTPTVDGIKSGTNGSEWEACAIKYGFSAPLQGSRKGEINAWFYHYSDGESLYFALEVADNDLGNRIFAQITETYTTDGVQAAGDEILVKDFDDASAPMDWYLTAQCVGNSAASLCGEVDTQDDTPSDPSTSTLVEIDASPTGSPSGLFFEWRRPFKSPNSSGSTKEDLNANSGVIGIKITKTQGQGGGKGGFVFPDARDYGADFFQINLQGPPLP